MCDYFIFLNDFFLVIVFMIDYDLRVFFSLLLSCAKRKYLRSQEAGAGTVTDVQHKQPLKWVNRYPLKKAIRYSTRVSLLCNKPYQVFMKSPYSCL